MRGHTLVWPSWKKSPRFLQALKSKPQKIKESIDNHIKDISLLTGKYLTHWDVVNELYSNNDLVKLLGESELTEWFKLARKSNPHHVKLFINDYDILTSEDPTRFKSYFEQIQQLLKRQAPIEGVGFQGHVKQFLTPPEEIYKRIEKFSKLGLPIFITEFDLIDGHRPELAKYMFDFYLTAYSHPAVKGIIAWNFWDGVTKDRKGILFDQNWNLKESGKSWFKFKDFMTTTFQGSTNAKGLIYVQGFPGVYSISIAQKSEAIGTFTLPEEHQTNPLILKLNI